MSDTPRTDKEELPHALDDHHFVVGSFFARQLERELNAANDRIKRLENDLSDAYAEMRKQRPGITAVFDNYSVWIKAKEAKL